MFWNVYYVKVAFLNAAGAYEVIQGMQTLTGRMLQKCINTQILARFFAAHPRLNVHCGGLKENENAELCQRLSFLGLPAPLFTIDLDHVPREASQQFFARLPPPFDHMISLGQSNTIVSCPAFTTHSELDRKSLEAAGIQPTTIRIAVGDEDPRDLLAHLIAAARLTIDPELPGFTDQFPQGAAVDTLIRECYLGAHRRYIENRRPFAEMLR